MANWLDKMPCEIKLSQLLAQLSIGIEDQNPSSRYVVLHNLYTTDDDYLMSVVIDRMNLPPLHTTDVKTINPVGFVADHTTMYYKTNNEDEAHYLAAILNSQTLDIQIKNLIKKQRNISSEILSEIYIPKFDSNNSTHLKLSEISKQLHKEVSKAVQKEIIQSATLARSQKRMLRKKILNIISAQLDMIDKTLKSIL